MQDHHEFRARGHDVEGSSDRSFGFVMVVAFTLFGCISWWRLGTAWPLYLALAALFLAIALGSPTWLAPLNRIWTRIGLLLAKVVNPIVMGAVFFVVITPIGWMVRVRQRDLLQMRADPSTSSYWIARDPSRSGSMKDQF